MNADQAKALRQPFPPEQIGQLPKGGTTLDFVGHAAVTDRLLHVDPEWSWEPLAYDTDGGPLIRYGTKEASLWIKLTIAGVTRIAVGTASASAFELDKQLISDAIRNGAMRFGVALDLWAKESLYQEPAYDPLAGWADRDVAADAHKELSERIRELSGSDRDRVKAACSTWPMNAHDFAQVTLLLGEIAGPGTSQATAVSVGDMPEDAGLTTVNPGPALLDDDDPERPF